MMENLEENAKSSKIIVLNNTLLSIEFEVICQSKNTKTGSFKGSLCSAVSEILDAEVSKSIPIKIRCYKFLAEEQEAIAKLFGEYREVYDNLSYEFL